MYTNLTSDLITNAFGGKMFIGSAKQSSTDEDSFIILITQIPQAACVSIATTEWGGDAGSGLLGMQILGNTAATAVTSASALSSSTAASLNNDSAKGVDNLPYSVVSASTVCSSSANLNSIAWKYL
jgi:hypothetical protein